MGNQVCQTIRQALTEISDDPLNWSLASSKDFTALSELSPDIRSKLIADFVSQFSDPKFLVGMSTQQRMEFDCQAAAVKDIVHMLQGQTVEIKNTRLDEMTENSLWSNTLDRFTKEGSSKGVAEQVKIMLVQQILKLSSMAGLAKQEAQEKSTLISLFEEEVQILLEKNKKTDRESSMQEGKRNLVLVVLKDLLTDIVDAQMPDRADLLDEILLKVSSIKDLIDPTHSLNDCEYEIAQIVQEMIHQLLNLVMLQTDNLSSFERLEKAECQKVVNFVCSLTVYLSRATVSFEILSRLIKFNMHRHFEISKLANLPKDYPGVILGPVETKSRLEKHTLSPKELTKSSIIADNSYYYFHSGTIDDNLIKVTARSNYGDAVVHLRTITVPKMTEHSKLVNFGGRCWILDTKISFATELCPPKESGLGVTINIGDSGIDSLIAATWTGAKVYNENKEIIAVGGDSSEVFWMLCERKIKQGTNVFRSLVLSKHTLSSDLKCSEVYKKVLIKDSEPLKWNNKSETIFGAYCHGFFILNHETGKVDIVDVERAELKISNCRTESLISNDESVRWNGYDGLKGRLLSINNDFIIRERPFIIGPHQDELEKTAEPSDQTATLSLPKLAESFGLMIEEGDPSTEGAENKQKENNASKSLITENLRKAVTSLAQQAFAYYSVRELEHLNEGFKDKPEFKKVALQRCFELNSSTFESLKDISSTVADLGSPELSSNLLSLLTIYLDDALALQDYQTGSTKLMKQRTVFHIRLALEKLSNQDCSKLSSHKRSIYHRNLLISLAAILRLSVSIKDMNYEGFYDAILSGDYFQSRALITRILIEFGHNTSEGRIESSTAMMLNLVEKTIAAAKEIIDVEKEYLKEGPNQKGFALSYELMRKRFNVESVIRFLLRSHAELTDSSKKSLLGLAASISNAFLDSTSEVLKKVNYTSESKLLDYFLFSSMAGDVFYKYLGLLMCNSDESSQNQLQKLSQDYLNLVQGLKLPKDTQSANLTPEVVEQLKLEATPDVTKLGMFRKISLPEHTELEIETQGFDSILDTLVIFACYRVPKSIVRPELKYDTVLVPYAYIHRNTKITVPFNEIVVAMKSEMISKPQARTISAVVRKATQSESSSSALGTLRQICLNNTLSMLSSPGLQSEQLIESKQESLLVAATQSSIFFNGVDFEKYQPAELEKSEGTTLEKCQDLYVKLLKMVGINEENRQIFEQLCADLQASTRRKSLYSELLGELGYLLNKCVFVLALYHDKLIELLSHTMLTVHSNEKLWIVCTAVRALGRPLESDTQFADLFSKMFMLASILPHDNIDEVSHTHLVPTKSIMEAVSPVRSNLTSAFFDSIGLRRSISSVKKKSNSASDNVISFLSLKVNTSDIVQFIKERCSESEKYQEKLELLEGFILNEDSDFSECLNLFNTLFRRHGSFLDFVSPDYSSLPQAAAQQRVRSLQKIVNRIMHGLCVESITNKQTLMLTLDSLKWMWRAQETFCVAAIDIKSIAANNWILCQDPEVRISMVELSGSILKFWVDNFSDMKISKSSGSDYKVLSTLQLIIKSTVSYLQSVISSCVENMDNISAAASTTQMQEWAKSHEITKDWYFADQIAYKSRRLEEEQENGLVNGMFVMIENSNHLDYIDGQRIVSNTDIIKRTEPQISSPVIKKQGSANSGVGWLFDDDTPEEKPAQAEPKTAVVGTESGALGQINITQKLASWSKVNQSVNDQVQCSKNALVYIYHFIDLGKEKTASFFDNTLYDILAKLCIGEYPDELTSRAATLHDLTLIHHEACSDLNLSKLFESIIRVGGNSNVRESLKKQAAKRRLLRQYLYFSSSCDVISKALSNGSPTEVIRALEVTDISFNRLQVGEMVYRQGDSMKEPYLIIEKTPGLSSQSILRNHLHLTQDLHFDTDIRGELLSKCSVNSSLLTISTRTKSFRWFDESELCLMDPTFDRARLSSLAKSLNLDSLAASLGSSVVDLYALYRLTEIANLLPGSKLRSTLENKLTGMTFHLPSSSHMATNVMQEIVSRFINSANLDNLKQTELKTIIKAEAFSTLKEKVYAKIRGRFSAKTKVSQRENPKDQNLYYFGKAIEADRGAWTTADSNHSNCQSEGKIASMIYELIDRRIRSWNVQHMQTKSALESILSLWKSKSTQKMLESFSELRSEIPTIIKSKKDLHNTLASLIDLGVELLDSPKLTAELNTTKIFALIVEFIALLNYNCQKCSIEMADPEKKLDSILTRVIINDHLDSGSVVKNYKHESLQNIILLMARHAVRLVKHSEAKIEHKDAHRWLTVMNDRLASVCLPDDQQENTIIKGILTWLLQSNEKFENPWAVSCILANLRPELKLGAYRNWMVVSNQEKNLCYSLFNDAHSKVPFKSFAILSELYRNDLCVQSRFEAEPNSSVYVESALNLNYGLTRSLIQTAEYLGPTLPSTSGKLNTAICNYLIADGKAYFSDFQINRKYGMFDNVTLADRSNYYGAMYLESSRELVVHRKDLCKEPSQNGPNLMNRGQEQLENWMIDLSSMPKMTKILSVQDGFIILLKAEDDSLVLVEGKGDYDSPGAASLPTLKSFLRLISGRPETKIQNHKHANIDVYRPTSNITDMTFNKEYCMAEIDKGSHRELVYFDVNKWIYATFKIDQEKVIKMIYFRDSLYALMESGLLFSNKNLEFEKSGTKKNILYLTVEVPTYARRKVKDIIIWNRASVIAIQEIADTGAYTVAAVDDNEFDSDFCPFIGCLTAESRFMENPYADSADLSVTGIDRIRNVEIIEDESSEVNNAKLPTAFCLLEGIIKTAHVDSMSNLEVFCPDLVVIQTRHAIKKFGWEELLAAYESYTKKSTEPKEFNPEDLTTAKCIYWSPTQGIVPLATKPENLADLGDYVFLIKTATSFKPKIKKLVTHAANRISLIKWSDNNGVARIDFFPDYLKMPNDEFVLLKEELKHIWEPHYDEFKASLAKYKELSMIVSMKNLDNDPEYRSGAQRMIVSPETFKSTHEYRRYRSFNTEEVDDEVKVDKALSCMQILNHYYADYFIRLPVFEGRCLDPTYNTLAEKNTFSIFFLSQFRPNQSSSNVCHLDVNKFKSLKQTTLKNQNFSLLNQYIAGYDLKSNGFKSMRTRMDLNKFSFLGEGSIYLM